MINKLQKGLVDLVYGVGRVRTKYERENPAEKVVAADGSKAINTNNDKDVDWDIPLENIETARLLKIGSLFGQGQVLKIKTKDNSHYQFGMQFNPEWTEQTFLPLALERGKVKTSRFSLIVRIIAIGYLIYWALERLN